MKTLVTGADGFIGSHLVSELVVRGQEVTALAQYNSFNRAGWLDVLDAEILREVDVQFGDVRDSSFMRRAIRGHSRVAHLAALIAIPHSYNAPASYVETNTLGTLNILEAAMDAGVERVVHTSTSEVYGTAQYVPIDEGHPLSGQSPYSASKIGADQLATSFFSSFDLPVVTVRPFNAYGPRQSQRAFIPSVIVQLIGRSPNLQLGSLTPTRDLTFVTDTARGFADVLGSDLGAGQTFNMGSGFEVSMGAVVEELCKIAGKSPGVVLDDRRVRPEQSEVHRLVSDSSKMFEFFSWVPEYAEMEGLRRGLEATYQWFTRSRSAGYDPNQYVV